MQLLKAQKLHLKSSETRKGFLFGFNWLFRGTTLKSLSDRISLCCMCTYTFNVLLVTSESDQAEFAPKIAGFLAYKITF